MKRVFLAVTTICLLLYGTASAEDFSLYGVSMGMSRSEVETHWSRLEGDKYGIEGSLILDLLPMFDHRDRLYKVSFSVPVPLVDQYPGNYVTTAFQDTVQQRWSHPDLVLNLRTGRGIVDITLTSKPLEQEFMEHIRAQMQVHLSTLLKP